MRNASDKCKITLLSINVLDKFATDSHKKMLPISEELKIIQASTTAEERAQRVQQLQHRLHEDEMRRKLRNVRLISSVERLAERAASLRELTDRLRLIKRQYEVLATHLPDDEPGDQSQHGEQATSVRNSQSATSIGEAQLHRQMIAAQAQAAGFHAAGSGDLAAGPHHLVEGYYDPRLAARGWQGGVDPWGPAGQQLGRDELGRSTESRAALLRSRIATSVTVRADPPPPPPGGRLENYPSSSAAAGAVSVAEAWDRSGASASGGTSQWDRHERSESHNRSEWDRPRTEHDRDRSGPDRTERTERSSAPMRDRSFTEYSVSAPGRRRAAPPAWDGTLDGVASRWGTMERPPGDEEQLQQLDSALARQRQLLAATAAAAAETAERRAEMSHDEGVPLPRLRTGSWLNDPSTLDRQHFEHDHGDHDPRLADQDPRGWESDPRQRPRETSVRFDGSADNDRYTTNSHGDRRGPTYDSNDREYRASRDGDRRESEPRCEEHRTLHEAEHTRRHHEGDTRDWGDHGRHQEEMEDVRRAVRRDGRGESVETEQALRRQESLRKREEEERRAAAEEERRLEEEDRRREDEESRRWEEERRREEERRQREEEERRQREEEESKRREEENRRREEEERRRQEEEKQQQTREAAERQTQAGRKASVTSNVSSNGGQSRGGRASVVSTGSGATAPGRPQNGANGGKQKKKNMDWLLGGGGGSSGDSDNGGVPGGSSEKPTGGDTQVEKSAADRPAAGSRKSSQGSTTTATAPIPAVRRPADTSSSDEAAPARPAHPATTPAATAASAAAAATAAVASAAAAITGAAAPEKPVKLRLDSGSDSYHLSADLGGDESDDDFWG